MKYYKLTAENGYAGCDLEDYVAFPDSWTEKQINDYAREWAMDEESMWEDCATDEIYEGDFETEEEYNAAIDEALDDYYANIGYDYEEITKEEWAEYGG